MSATASSTVSLSAILDEHHRLHAIWRNSRQESDRLAAAGAWALAITAPGAACSRTASRWLVAGALHPDRPL